MPLIVDTFNVLHTTGILPPDLSGLDIDELRGVIGLSRFRDQEIHLICDGVEPRRMRRDGLANLNNIDDDQAAEFFNMSMQWSGTMTDADTLIEIFVAQHSAPRRLTVVTSDRRLGRVVRKRQVRVMPSEDFLQRLSDDFRSNLDHLHQQYGSHRRPAFADTGARLHGESVRWWLDYLNLDPNHPTIDGQHVPASPEVPQVVEPTDPVRDAIAEADPLRWWLRYFGLNPDDLPADFLVEAAVDRDASDDDETSSEINSANPPSTPIDQTNEEGGRGEIEIDEIDPEAFL